MSGDLVYKPSAWGQLFHSLQQHEALGAGAAGPGKTTVLLADPLPQIIVEHERCTKPDHPHRLRMGESTGWALHLRREFPMLENTIARAHRMFPRIDPGVRWDSQKHMFIFSSGYRFQFGHCRDPNDWEIYFSSEYTHLGFDELVQFLEEQYDQIRFRVRSTDPVLRNMLKVRAMSNPLMRREGNFTAKNHDPHWVRKRFVDPEPAGRVTLKSRITRQDGTEEFRTRIYLPATLYDNPDPVFVRQYEESLLSAPAHIRQAMLYGNWYATAGGYFADDWNPSLHVIKPFKIPPTWKRFRSMDWGYKSPGCVLWWAMDEDENLYCEYEFTFKMMDAPAVAKRIVDIENRLGISAGSKSQITGPADTQLWEERGERGRTKADEMAAAGVLWMRADKKSRTRNAQRILDRMRDHDGGTAAPGIMWMQNCKMCIQTIPALQTDSDDLETPQDGGDDHWFDACAYAAAFASRGRAGIPAMRKTQGEDDDEAESSADKRRNMGRYGYGSRYL